MKTFKEFLHYVIPSMLAFALSGVYAIADGFFVGNALGDSALAAINIAYPLTAFLQAAGTGIGMGGAVRYAISMGEKNPLRGRQYFGISTLLLLLCGVFFTITFLLAAPSVLLFFGASGGILTLAGEYIRYIAYGAVFQILGTGLVPFIRNMGGSVTAMTAMIAGFITNILLDYLFVWRFSYGMAGAAVATVIGQAVTVLICMAFFIIKKAKPLFMVRGNGPLLAGNILKVGLSPFGLTFSPNIMLILINKSAAVSGGVMAVTCYAPVSYISSVIMLLLQGISDGIQPLLSLSYGKGSMERTKRFCSLSYRFAAITAVCCMIVLFLLRGQAAVLFGASAQVTGMVAQILPIFLCGYPFIAISRVTTAYFYTTEKSLQACLLIYGEIIFLFILLLILPEFAGVYGTWLSVSLSQFLAAIFSIFLMVRKRKSV